MTQRMHTHPQVVGREVGNNCTLIGVYVWNGFCFFFGLEFVANPWTEVCPKAATMRPRGYALAATDGMICENVAQIFTIL